MGAALSWQSFKRLTSPREALARALESLSLPGPDPSQPSERSSSPVSDPGHARRKADEPPLGSYFRFFDLPPELREAILALVVTFPFDPPGYGQRNVPVFKADRRVDPDAGALRWPPESEEYHPNALLRVSKSMYAEATAAWYAHNKFFWVIGHPRHAGDEPADYYEPLPEALVRDMLRVRRLAIHIMHLETGRHLEHHLVPTLRRLLDEGQLAYLDITLECNAHSRFVFDLFFPTYQRPQPPSRRGAWDMADYVPTTPLYSLLMLLARARLRRASLRIDRPNPGNPSFAWCPLHDYVVDDDDGDHHPGWGVEVRWRDFLGDLIHEPVRTKSTSPICSLDQEEEVEGGDGSNGEDEGTEDVSGVR